ncbi:MAG: DHH family phosphoesterase [Bacilli bacterium]|nr:DHH family phosphoesterase [Bacilli bacterium]
MALTIKNLKINLESKILNANNTFIVAHNNIDLDGLGSSVGLSLIPTNLGKHAYIVIDENDFSMDTLVQRLIEEKCENFKFVNKDECLDLITGNDLLILTDVNKIGRTCFYDTADAFKEIMVIDHHETDSTSITGPNSYVFPDASSASEIVAMLLKLSQTKYDENVATALLAGINLDTNNYTKNRGSATLRIIANLMDRGGDDAYITSLFMGDYSDNIKRYEVASRENTEFRTFTKETTVPIEGDEDTSFNTTFSIAIAADPEIRGKVVLAQAANYLLDFADVSITMANISSRTISVHGRSKGQINIGELFKKVDGGGSIKSSATEIHDCTLEEAKQKILSIFPPLSKPKKFV